jgi:PAS domain S-box-containing protein
MTKTTRSFEVQSKAARKDTVTKPGDEPYRAIVDTMTEGAVILAESGDILYANSCFASMIGCRPEETAGLAFSRYVSPSDRLHCANLLAYAVNRPGRAEVGLLRNGHEVVPASLSAAPLRAGETNGLYIVVSDISLRRRAEEGLLSSHQELEKLLQEKSLEFARATTQLHKEARERKRAEDRLSEEEERFRLLMENSSDILVILKGGAIDFAGPSVQRILGHKPEELTGRDFLTFTHEDDLHEAREVLGQGERIPGASFRLRIRMKMKSGTCRVLEFLGRNLCHNRWIGGLVLNGRDISDLKAMEDTLRNLENEVSLSTS